MSLHAPPFLLTLLLVFVFLMVGGAGLSWSCAISSLALPMVCCIGEEKEGGENERMVGRRIDELKRETLILQLKGYFLIHGHTYAYDPAIHQPVAGQNTSFTVQGTEAMGNNASLSSPTIRMSCIGIFLSLSLPSPS